MNMKEIQERVEAILRERSGNKPGGSGHLSSVTISDIKIDEINELKENIEVKVTYTVDILSEFDVAEESDPDGEEPEFDPYHYEKSEIIKIEK